MPGRDPFKGHRFLKDMILMAVRWYCRYPLSYRDVRDMCQLALNCKIAVVLDRLGS